MLLSFPSKGLGLRTKPSPLIQIFRFRLRALSRFAFSCFLRAACFRRKWPIFLFQRCRLFIALPRGDCYLNLSQVLFGATPFTTIQPWQRGRNNFLNPAQFIQRLHFDGQAAAIRVKPFLWQ